MRWPVVVLVSIVTLTAVVGVWLRLSSGVAVDAARAEIGSIDEYVEERGQTRLKDTFLVTMPYEGRIEAIELAEGDAVKKGQVVAHVVTRDLELRMGRAAAAVGRLDAALAESDDARVEQVALKQAESFARSMAESVKAAAARVTSGWEKFQYAGKSRQRIERLAATGVKTEDELDKARLAEVESEVDYKQDNLVHSAMVALQVATDLMPAVVQKTIERKQLRHAVLAKERAEAELARQQAETDLQRGTMRSPVDGVVLARPIRNERSLASGTVLMEIGRREDLEVEAEILSQEVVRVRLDAAVEILGTAVGHPPIRGQVRRIYPAGFTKVSSLGVEQQRVLVLVGLVKDDLDRLVRQRRLGVGYRVRVRIVTGTASRALRIARSALFRAGDGQWQVFTVSDGVASIQSVQVGLMNDDLVEVSSGLAEGDLVILSPPTGLTDGARVLTHVSSYTGQ